MGEIELTRSKAGIAFRTDHYYGPRSWNEMERKHLIIWAACMSSGVEEFEAQKICAAQLYGIPRNVYVEVIPAKDKVRLALSVGFLFKRNQLDKWLIPSFWHRFTKYHGPKSKLMNITVREFGLLEHCYNRFQETGIDGYLDHLAAILYRPRKYFGIDDDIRRPLRDHALQKRADRFAKLPMVTKWAIFLNYEGCRNFIHRQFREVYSTAGAIGSAKDHRQNNQWQLVINAASGGKFGTLTETENSNLHKFLLDLRERAKEIRE